NYFTNSNHFGYELMEELLLAAAICLLLGSSVFLYYYPIITILALAGTFGVSIHWWQNKKLLLAKKDRINQRLEKVRNHPEIEHVFIPDFEDKLASNLKDLENQLKQNDHDAVLEMVQDLSYTLQSDILTHKDQVISMLDTYINTNHRVINSEIKITKEKIDSNIDEHSVKMHQEILNSLLEKQNLFQNNKKQVIHYYTQIKSILLQIDNMKLKSSKVNDGQQLVLDFKSDLSKTLSQFNDANEVLDEIAKLNQ
ncbi:hypothetical protein MJH12_19360, partial [bacterium]|nr:hypothetical protein [bacterium]